MQEELFEVAKVTHITGDTWLVEGRAYDTIKLGDTLFLNVEEPNCAVARFPFTVAALSTYGVDVAAFYVMLTGGITLVGDEGERLLEAKMLTA